MDSYGRVESRDNSSTVSEDDTSCSNHRKDDGAGHSGAESVTRVTPVSTAKYYRRLKEEFDRKPVRHDRTPVALLPYEDDGGVWGGDGDGASPSLNVGSEALADTCRGEALLLTDSVKDFNLAKKEVEVSLNRARLPHAVFSITDFTEPVSGEDVFEPAAALLAERIRLDDHERRLNFVVSVGVRGCGALAQAVALRLNVPYSLSNWYPDGSVGDCRVDRCKGIGGWGWIYLNGVPRNSCVAVVVDTVQSGVTATRLVEGALGIEGCSVLGVYCISAMVLWRAPASPLRGGAGAVVPSMATAAAADVTGSALAAPQPPSSAPPLLIPPAAEGDPRLNGYYHHVESYQRFSGPATAVAAAAAQDDPRQPRRKPKKQPSVAAFADALFPSPPPLRSLFLVSLAGEVTHVLTRAEREMEWRASLVHQQAPHAAASPKARHRQSCLSVLYEPCFPTECPPPRRLPDNAVNVIKRMPASELQRKQRRVAASFAGVPIVANDAVGGYPYCFFALTDFKPALEPSLVEDMADLAVHAADFHRCEVLVSEGDRGGGPLLHAISLRTHQPYVIASWTMSTGTAAETQPPPPGDGHHVTSAASGVIQVGFGGSHCQLSLAGLRPGMRCIFVDDMLSSGGTAEAVLRCVLQLGARPVEAVFASEKLYPLLSDKDEGTQRRSVEKPRLLPVRKGRNRLVKLFSDTRLTCLAQFVVEGNRTVEPPCRVGE